MLFSNMSFWSSQKFEEKQDECKLIDNYEPCRIKHGAYELSLSQQVLISPKEKHHPWDGDGDALGIPPGQFAMLLTKETVSIPTDSIAFISIKATKKLNGLINISGFHVDPGFTGRLKFSVYNAGNLPVFLDYDKPTFLIWFADLDSSTRDPYNGKHKDQNGFTPQDRQCLSRESHSPSALADKIDQLERRISNIVTIAAVIFTVIVAPILTAWVMGLIAKLTE